MFSTKPSPSMDLPLRSFLPNRTGRLRLLAHTRHIVAVTLPLGAITGFMVALALKGLGSFEPMVLRVGGKTGLTILLPAIGLFLTTAWLTITGIGEVSLFKDLDLAKKNPYKVFPFRASLGKVVACALTIGFGGSVGASALAGATQWTLLVPVVFLAETTGQASLVVPALIGTTVSYLMVREVS